MRSILTLGLLMLASINVQAQELSAGLRANAGYWLTPKDQFGYHFEALQGNHMAVVPEVFVRYAPNKKWAFEASLDRSDHNYPVAYTVFFFSSHSKAAEEYKVRNNELTLSAQYGLSCRSLCKFPLFKRIHSYVGINIGMVMVQSESISDPDYSPNGARSVYENERYELWTGLSHNLTFNIGKRLMLISGLYFKVRPEVLLSQSVHNGYYNPVARFGGQFGAAYRF